MLVFLLIKPLKSHLIDAFGGFKEILSSLVKFINFTNEDKISLKPPKASIKWLFKGFINKKTSIDVSFYVFH